MDLVSIYADMQKDKRNRSYRITYAHIYRGQTIDGRDIEKSLGAMNPQQKPLWFRPLKESSLEWKQKGVYYIMHDRVYNIMRIIITLARYAENQWDDVELLFNEDKLLITFLTPEISLKEIFLLKVSI